jgi:hypothetical protein
MSRRHNQFHRRPQSFMFRTIAIFQHNLSQKAQSFMFRTIAISNNELTSEGTISQHNLSCRQIRSPFAFARFGAHLSRHCRSLFVARFGHGGTGGAAGLPDGVRRGGMVNPRRFFSTPRGPLEAYANQTRVHPFIGQHM